MVCQQPWPAYDESKCADETVEMAVQVNGKVRARIAVAADVPKDSALSQARANSRIQEELSGKKVVREIFVPRKLINFVVK